MPFPIPHGAKEAAKASDLSICIGICIPLMDMS